MLNIFFSKKLVVSQLKQLTLFFKVLIFSLSFNILLNIQNPHDLDDYEDLS